MSPSPSPGRWSGAWRSTNQDRWLTLFVVGRALATAVAVLLLVVHRVTDHDALLLAGALALGPLAIVAAVTSERVRRSPLLWGLDTVLVLGLVLASEDWRSPFYLMALTTLVFPAVTLRVRPAAVWGLAFSAAYLGVAAVTGFDRDTLDSTVRLESAATHVLVPVLVVLALTYASDLLVRLGREEQRAMGLAVDNERRRIGWELHDSAKQRVHAAHLLLTAGRARVDGATARLVDQALGELQAATGDMDTCVGALQVTSQARPLDEALRERAGELASMTDADVVVQGSAPDLPPTVNAHAYRIVSEALLNSVRHSGATRIDLELATRDGWLRARVTDDGRGMPEHTRPGAHGLSFMSHRAATIGGRLEIGPAETRGTSVTLDVPIHEGEPT